MVKEGVIAGKGTHETLMLNGEIYAKLYHNRFQGQKHANTKKLPYRKTDQSEFTGWYNHDVFMLLKPTDRIT